MLRDIKRIEELLAGLEHARDLVRDEMKDGASLQHLYDDLNQGVQTISTRLKDLKDFNAKEQAKGSPTLEQYVSRRYKPENYPQQGCVEVDSPGLREYKAKVAAAKEAAAKAEADKAAAEKEAAEKKAAAEAEAAAKAAADKEAAEKAAADKAAAAAPATPPAPPAPPAAAPAATPPAGKPAKK